jgi:hypothetical protein
LLIFIGRKKVKSGTGASFGKHVPVVVDLADAIAKPLHTDHASGRRLISGDRAVDRIDQSLHLDEFGACPFRLVAIEWRGKDLGMGIAFFEYAISRLLQIVQSFAHEWLACLLPRPALPGNHRPTLRRGKPNHVKLSRLILDRP